jgi:Mrp family chromosome partitioning ATPase
MAAPPLVPVMPRMAASAPIAPMRPMTPPKAAAAASLAVSTIADVAASLRGGGEAGRRVCVIGSAHNVGTTYAAISLARALGTQGSAVLVDLAFSAPNLSVISTDPQAPGMAEFLRGQASFADIITRDQFSNVHLVATGNVGGDGAGLAASPMLPSAIDALAQSYDFVVVDSGAIGDVATPPLASHAMLIAPEMSSVAARSAHDRLAAAGFADVNVVLGGAEAAAA